MSDSIRDDLNAAFTELGGTDADVSGSTPAPPPVETSALPAEPSPPPSGEKDGSGNSLAPETVRSSESDSARVRDDKGRFAPKAEAAPDTPASEPKPPPNGNPTQPQPPQPKSAEVPKPETIRPPQGWKASAREKWPTVPPDIQAEISRRERETSIALNEATEARKFHQAFQQRVGPFEGMIRAEGGDPLGAVENLLQVAMALRTAPPKHKAQLLANMVRTFNIPVDALDQELSGGQQPGQQASPAEFRDPRVDQMLAERAAEKQQREQAAAQRAQQIRVEFAEKHEFFEDVRVTMRKLMEAELATDLEDAYAQAVMLHPDVRDTIKQREAAKQANAATASTQRARDAASSVKSMPANAGNGVHKGGSIRDDLMASFHELSGR